MMRIKLKNIYNEEVTVEMVDNEKQANFITHSGTFHADDVMTTVILLNKFRTMKLFRTSNLNNNEAFVYDIGFGLYDHHGIDFNEKRDNGIKYASCGLVWKKFGYEIVSKLDIENKNEFVDSIDKNLIMDIDRDDNGQSLTNEPEIKQQTIPSLIANFNPSWNDKRNDNECFLDAVFFANQIFNNMVSKMVSKEQARKIVEEDIKKSKDGILILDNYMPWKDIVLSSSNPKAKEILYAVFPSKRSGYNVVATPISTGSFNLKKPFPGSWAGKENEELQSISGVETITFCHKNLFICSCKTFDDAVKIAKIAVSYKENVNNDT